MLHIRYVPMVVYVGKVRRSFEFTVTSPSDAVLKNAWRYTATALYAFKVLCLMEHRDLLVFTSFTEKCCKIIQQLLTVISAISHSGYCAPP